MEKRLPAMRLLWDVFPSDETKTSIAAREDTHVDLFMSSQLSKLNLIIAVALFLCFSLALWRLWVFTIRPLVHPDEAREIPYWIPYLGHAIGFFRDSHGLITRASASTSDNDPYCIMMSGERFYMLTDPRDAATTFAKTQTLAWSPYLKRLMLQFGVRQSSLPNIWEAPGSERPKYNNPLNHKHRSLVQYSEDLYRRQLVPGPNLDSFSFKISELLIGSLQWRELSSLCVSKKKIPLMDLCAHVSIDAMTRCLFGNAIYDIQPRINHMLYDFCEEAWKLLMVPYPKIAAKRLHSARQGILDTLVKYMRMPSEKRTETAWFWGEILKEQEASDLDELDRASITFMLLWAANINVYRLSHWVLSYVLCESELLIAVKAEIGPAFRNKDVDYRHIYDHCPRLTAVYTELLRLTFGSFSVRKITAPIIMGKKKLRSNSSVIVPIRSLHYNSKAFGENAEEFDANRFLDNSLDKNPSFRPFAGGITYCPGRFLAKRQTLVFVATLINRYEVEVFGGSKAPDGVCRPPQIDQIGPSLGIMAPVKETQLFVRLKQAVQ